MKQLIFTIFSLVVFLWLEITLANSGFMVPLVLWQIFYITIVRRWVWSLLASVIICVPMDNLLGYISLPAAMVVIVLGTFWRRRGDCSRLQLQIVSVGGSLFLALLVLILTIIFKYRGDIEWLYWGGQIIFGLTVVSLLTPFMILVQDYLAAEMEISTYLNIQKEELYSVTD